MAALNPIEKPACGGVDFSALQHLSSQGSTLLLPSALIYRHPQRYSGLSPRRHATSSFAIVVDNPLASIVPGLAAVEMVATLTYIRAILGGMVEVQASYKHGDRSLGSGLVRLS